MYEFRYADGTGRAMNEEQPGKAVQAVLSAPQAAPSTRLGRFPRRHNSRGFSPNPV